MNDIEIKSIEAKEIAKPTKITLYCCVYFNDNGILFANSPTEDKRYQEQYAYSMGKNVGTLSIYKFEVDAPREIK
jgi:hypothetical protein